MTSLLSTTPAVGPGDAQLIAAVRAGDVGAYGILFERHVEAARRLAAHLAPPSETDDLVSDSFAKVLGVLQRGGGPDLAFRAYLLTALRRLHIDRLRTVARTRPVDDLTAYDTAAPLKDPVVAEFENTTAAKAFASLPERWQMVLWHTEVEKLRPQEIAPLLGVSANSVAALSYRAREGLRQAFVSMHANSCPEEECARVRSTLGSFIRRGTSRRANSAVDAHLAQCRPCTAIHTELLEVNADLGAWLAPVLLGTVGNGYLVATGSLSGLSTVVVALTDRMKETVANPAAVVGSALVAAAAATGLGFALIGTPFLDDGSSETTAESGIDAGVDRDAGSGGSPALADPAGSSDPADPAISVGLEPDLASDTSDPAGATVDFRSPNATAAPPTTIGNPSDSTPVQVIPDTAAGSATGPSTAPSPVEPEPVDLSLLATRSGSALTTQGIRLDVVGLPKGRTATLVVTEEVGRGRQVMSDRRCRPTPAGAECAVSSRPEPFQVTLSRLECSTYLVQIVLDEGTDPSQGNNSTRVTLGSPALACVTTGLLDVTLRGEARGPVQP